MKTFNTLSTVLFSLMLMMGNAAHAVETKEAPHFFTVESEATKKPIDYSAGGALARDGFEQANIFGDPKKPGEYITSLRGQPGASIPAHWHYDWRLIIVKKGIWCTGYGDKFDASKLVCLVAGKGYTEPPGVNHFVLVKGDTPAEVEVHGFGISGRVFVDQDSGDHQPKN